MNRVVSGFTLVEVLVVLAVLAIVTTIGYPLYVEQSRNGRRTDAQVALTRLALAQERHFGLFGEFAETPTELNLGPDAVINGDLDTYSYDEAISDLDRDNDGSVDYYTIVIATDGDATTSDFTITANAAGVQAEDLKCALFRIDQIGTKYAEDSGGSENSEKCWK
jgi:type IV pilus assembly protein PilE